MNRTVPADTTPAALPKGAAFLWTETLREIAQRVALIVPLCERCKTSQGLCKWHAEHIAALAQPFWYQLVGTAFYGKAQAEREKDIATQRLLGRKERRRTKRAKERASELRALVEDIASPRTAA